MKSKASVLVVEDENLVAKDIMMTLKTLGYAVVGTASTGEDAIRKTVKTKPDLVLMDIGLKGAMDGLEAAGKISALVDTPIVFLTAYSDDQRLQKAKNVRVFGYIVKPFEEKNLNSTIQIALHKHSMEKELELQKNYYVDLYQETMDGQDAKLDTPDRKILCELDMNSRMPAADIGKKTMLSKGTVKYRISRLIENKYIDKFYTIVNAALFGYKYHDISMRFHKLTAETERQVVDFVQEEHCCTRLRVIEENSSMAFMCTHKDTAGLNEFLRKFAQVSGDSLAERDISKVTRVHKFGQRFLLEGKGTALGAKNDRMFVADGATHPLDVDETDRGIIRLLSANARIKLVEMAEKLGVDWKVVKYRMKRMEEKGILVAYTTALNLPKLRQQLVQISISLKNPAVIPEITGFFRSTGACMFAYEAIGKHDMSVDLCVKSDEALSKIMDDFRKRFLNQCINYGTRRISREYVFNFSPL